jgi:hypothetical protein
VDRKLPAVSLQKSGDQPLVFQGAESLKQELTAEISASTIEQALWLLDNLDLTENQSDPEDFPPTFIFTLYPRAKTFI